MTFAQRVARRFKAVFVAQIVQMVAKGVVILLLTRYFLQPAEYGLLFFALSILGVALLFANLGLAKSAARYLTKYREANPSQVPHVLALAFKYNLVSILVVSVVLGVGASSVSHLLAEPALEPFLIVGIGYVIARSLHTFVRLTFQGFNQTQLSAYVSIIASVGSLVFILLFIFLDFGAIGALMGYAVSYAAAALCGLGVLYVRWIRTSDSAETVADGLPRRILNYSVPLTVTRGANVLDKQIDTILIGFFLTPVAVSYYTLSKQISEFIMAPAASLGFTISPTYGEQKANENISRARQIYETTLQHVLLVYVPAAVGMILVAPSAIRLVFGEAYAGAILVVQVFSGYVVLQAITNITSDGLDYLGRARTRAVAKGGTAAANFGLNLLLIPWMGVVGAAYATVFTHSIYVTVNLYVVHQELTLRIGYLLRQVLLVSAIAIGMAISVMVTLSYGPTALSVVTAIVVGVCVWGVLSILSGFLELSQLQAHIG